MNYSLSVQTDNTKEFGESDQANFVKRNKMSSKCVDKILTSDYKFESPPITGNQRKLGLPTAIPFSIKPNSSININSKSSLKLTSPDSLQSSNINIAVKLKDQENLDRLLSSCIKEGKEFEDTLKLLESENYIETTTETPTDERKYSENSSGQEDNN